MTKIYSDGWRFISLLKAMGFFISSKHSGNLFHSADSWYSIVFWPEDVLNRGMGILQQNEFRVLYMELCVLVMLTVYITNGSSEKELRHFLIYNCNTVYIYLYFTTSFVAEIYPTCKLISWEDCTWCIVCLILALLDYVCLLFVVCYLAHFSTVTKEIKI